MRSIPFPVFAAIILIYTGLLMYTRQKSEYCYSLVHGTYETHRGAQEKVKCESETKKKPRPQIGVVEVLTAEASPEFYYTAISSIACYSKIHGYTFHLIYDHEYRLQCPQDDKFFRRHCVVARMLRYYDYVLFLDADIGVVNPSKSIEEFLDPHADVVFIDRFYNFEVMTGSYLVKNSAWSRQFLLEFADYSSRISKNELSSDNVALHAYLAERIVPKNNTELATCIRIYDNIKGYGDLFLYEVCIRKLLGYGTSFGRIKILHKGTGWVRDPRMTNSKWSKERDFMFHNWKEWLQISYVNTPISVKINSSLRRTSWYNPIIGELNLSLCTPGNTTWNMDENLIESQLVIEAQLKEYEQEVEKMRKKLLAHLALLTDLWFHETRNESFKVTLEPLNQSWLAYAM